MRPAIQASRTGTVLIVVAGISALLVMLALAFLVRMRSDGEESARLLAETQARVMFAAALNYIAETSRIGWDDPATPEHEEAFGWVDVRDGRPGPRDYRGNQLFVCSDPTLGTGPSWPAVGTWTICDARLWTRAPTAIASTVVLNPIRQDPSLDWRTLVAFPTPDPQPVSSDLASFLAGDRTPLRGADNPCWFRIYRRKPGVFIITCGAGNSGGYRSWSEVQAAGQTARWGSVDDWQSERLLEPILWYEVEWNGGVGVTSSDWIYRNDGDKSIVPATVSMLYVGGQNHPNKRSQMGTFLYLERLQQEPDTW